MLRTSIAGAIAFTSLAVVLVLGTMVLGVDDKATPFVTMVLGFIGLSVSQLMNTQKTEKTSDQVTQLSNDLKNGTMETILREAIEEVAADDETSLVINHNSGREED